MRRPHNPLLPSVERYTIGYMEKTSTKSFLKFTFGFVTFLVLSFGLTIAVSNYSKAQTTQQAAAAALSVMLQ